MKDFRREIANIELSKLAKRLGFSEPTSKYFLADGTLVNIEEVNSTTYEIPHAWGPIQKEDWNREGWVVDNSGGMCFGCKGNSNYQEAFSTCTLIELKYWALVTLGYHLEVTKSGDDEFWHGGFYPISDYEALRYSDDQTSHFDVLKYGLVDMFEAIIESKGL